MNVPSQNPAGAIATFAFGGVMFAIVGVSLFVDLRNRKRIRRHIAGAGGRVSSINRVMIMTKRAYIPVHYEVAYVDAHGKHFRKLCQSNRRGVFWRSEDQATGILSLDGRSWPKLDA